MGGGVGVGVAAGVGAGNPAGTGEMLASGEGGEFVAGGAGELTCARVTANDASKHPAMKVAPQSEAPFTR